MDTVFWRIRDSRGGLLLLALEQREDCCPRWWLHMVFCDPLAWRYMAIPPLERSSRYHLHSGPFLLDGGGGGVSLSSFRVMCVVVDDRRGSAFTSPLARV